MEAIYSQHCNFGSVKCEYIVKCVLFSPVHCLGRKQNLRPENLFFWYLPRESELSFSCLSRKELSSTYNVGPVTHALTWHLISWGQTVFFVYIRLNIQISVSRFDCVLPLMINYIFKRYWAPTSHSRSRVRDKQETRGNSQNWHEKRIIPALSEQGKLNSERWLGR